MLFTGLFVAILQITALAQEAAVFSVEVSASEVALGNYFEITFTLENIQGGQFQEPDFSDFHILAGPNTRSNMTIVNGAVSQTLAYSYYLEPKEIGNYFISSASIEAGETILETPPVEIIVIPNPNGEAGSKQLEKDQPIKQSQEVEVEPKEPKKKKKKRKIVRL